MINEFPHWFPWELFPLLYWKQINSDFAQWKIQSLKALCWRKENGTVYSISATVTLLMYSNVACPSQKLYHLTSTQAEKLLTGKQRYNHRAHWVISSPKCITVFKNYRFIFMDILHHRAPCSALMSPKAVLVCHFSHYMKKFYLLFENADQLDQNC